MGSHRVRHNWSDAAAAAAAALLIPRPERNKYLIKECVRLQTYLGLLCFTLLLFTHIAFFYINRRFAAAQHWVSLLALFFPNVVALFVSVSHSFKSRNLWGFFIVIVFVIATSSSLPSSCGSYSSHVFLFIFLTLNQMQNFPPYYPGASQSCSWLL